MFKKMRVFHLAAVFAGTLAFLAANSADAQVPTGSATVEMNIHMGGGGQIGREVCSDALGIPPGDPNEDFPNAEAQLSITQTKKSADLRIAVSGAAPHTIYTVWLFVNNGPAAGTLRQGGGPTMSAALPSETPELVRGTPPGALKAALRPSADADLDSPNGLFAGTHHSPNSFTTNANGDGIFHKFFPFPIVDDVNDSDAVYPFPKTKRFLKKELGLDKDDLKSLNLAKLPFRTGLEQTRISVVSHCGVPGDPFASAHGLTSFTDERWFILDFDPFNP